MCQYLSKDTSLPLKTIVFPCPTNYFMFIRSPLTFVFANLFTLKHRIGCRNELKSRNPALLQPDSSMRRWIKHSQAWKTEDPGQTQSLPLINCVTTEKLLNLYGHLLNSGVWIMVLKIQSLKVFVMSYSVSEQ